MVKDIIKFNRLCTDLAKDKKLDNLELTVGEFLNKHRLSQQFRDWYFLPMVGAIWSCPVAQMLNFPISTMIRFCFNHGLIQISDRPQWLTVQGGSREYVKKIVAHLENHGSQFKRSQVKSVVRKNNSVEIITDTEINTYDHVVMACHSDQALKVLSDASADESAIWDRFIIKIIELFYIPIAPFCQKIKNVGQLGTTQRPKTKIFTINKFVSII